MAIKHGTTSVNQVNLDSTRYYRVKMDGIFYLDQLPSGYHYSSGNSYSGTCSTTPTATEYPYSVTVTYNTMIPYSGYGIIPEGQYGPACSTSTSQARVVYIGLTSVGKGTSRTWGIEVRLESKNSGATVSGTVTFYTDYSLTPGL